MLIADADDESILLTTTAAASRACKKDKRLSKCKFCWVDNFVSGCKIHKTVDLQKSNNDIEFKQIQNNWIFAVAKENL